MVSKKQNLKTHVVFDTRKAFEGLPSFPLSKSQRLVTLAFIKMFCMSHKIHVLPLVTLLQLLTPYVYTWEPLKTCNLEINKNTLMYVMIFDFVFLFLMFHVGVSFPYSEEYSKSYYTICTDKVMFNLPHPNVKWN